MNTEDGLMKKVKDQKITFTSLFFKFMDKQTVIQKSHTALLETDNRSFMKQIFKENKQNDKSSFIELSGLQI